MYLVQGKIQDNPVPVFLLILAVSVGKLEKAVLNFSEKQEP
jgi:hypothetical protein